MIEVYMAGTGLASALGRDLRHAIVALRSGGVSPVPFKVAEGVEWPLYAIAEGGSDWSARARWITELAVLDCGALKGPRTGPLFVATSSMDIGAREDSSAFDGDYQTFAETVAEWLDWRGQVFTVSTACTSSLNALLSARTIVAHGHADHALVLGLELRNRVTVGGFGAMQLLAPTRALPFGEERDGMVLGEAVAALHLSSVPSRWRIAGGSNFVDGQDSAGAVPSAVVAMCLKALADSGLEPADIALVKAQAAGSTVTDAIEARALGQVFGILPALVSFKAAIGHTLGAAGAAELALLIACLESGAWPKFDYAPDSALNAPLATVAPQNARYLLAYILGFGGGHSAVVLEDREA